MSDRTVLDLAARRAQEYLAGVAGRHVPATATSAELLAQLGGALPSHGLAPEDIVNRLAQAAERGTVATQGPRYFGFVVGGSLPVATAADWLVSTWDQNAGIYLLSPMVSVIEDVAGGWLRELAMLPPDWSTGFVTGCQMANFTALATARHHVLAAAGWDVGARGLYGAPDLHVVVSDESHYTIFNALRLLGLGADRVTRVPADAQGRMRAELLPEVLARSTGPCIVCAQAGNVNTGSFDPIAAIADAARARGAWLHVDGAFGLWAAASPARASLVAGIDRADSVASDAHKWLNVPYDCGLIFCAHPASHRAAMSTTSAYVIATATERDPRDFVPEESRRARSVPVYAALLALGRDGLGELVDRCCRLATRMAGHLAKDPALRVLNDVVLNQILVRVEGADADERTRAMIARLQADGTCWASGTTWHGMAALRISISNWSTTDADIDRSAEAIRRAVSAASRP